MKTVNMQVAKTHLSKLVDDALSGDEIVIAKAGKPLVTLVPCRPRKTNRVGGQLAEQIADIPVNFDALDPEIQSLFHS